MSLIIQDNGVGIDFNNIKYGRGITNVRKRMTDINATIDFQSQDILGTKVKLDVPL